MSSDCFPIRLFLWIHVVKNKYNDLSAWKTKWSLNENKTIKTDLQMNSGYAMITFTHIYTKSHTFDHRVRVRVRVWRVKSFERKLTTIVPIDDTCFTTSCWVHANCLRVCVLSIQEEWRCHAKTYASGHQKCERKNYWKTLIFSPQF